MRGSIGSLLVVATLAASCGPTVDLSQGLQVVGVSTGWNDAGMVNGQNKVVPSATFTLKNVSDQTLVSLQANVIFRREGEPEEWGAAFLSVAGSEGLAPGASSAELVATSQLGYTGTEPKLEMLQNSHFVDAKVEIFAKYGSTQWTKVGEYPVERQLRTP